MWGGLDEAALGFCVNAISIHSHNDPGLFARSLKARQKNCLVVDGGSHSVQ